MPVGPDGQTTAIPLGHEPAGEIAEAGAEVTGLKTGDRVVVNPQAAPSGIIGCGGALGAMREYLLIENAVAGTSMAVFPDTLPFEVAALNEPMAIGGHCVNRSQAGPADKIVAFGAGPIGLGAVIWLKLRGVRHVAVADVLPRRLQMALAAGADAPFDGADAGEQLIGGGAAVGRDLDEDAAAVAGVGGAADPAAAFEEVGRCGHGG
jgi:(R,R)-butanediol dehydrogenase/meso-butanediol dehydrogenase/diacetyl reductase